MILIPYTERAVMIALSSDGRGKYRCVESFIFKEVKRRLSIIHPDRLQYRAVWVHWKLRDLISLRIYANAMGRTLLI